MFLTPRSSKSLSSPSPTTPKSPCFRDIQALRSATQTIPRSSLFLQDSNLQDAATENEWITTSKSKPKEHHIYSSNKVMDKGTDKGIDNEKDKGMKAKGNYSNTKPVQMIDLTEDSSEDLDSSNKNTIESEHKSRYKYVKSPKRTIIVKKSLGKPPKLNKNTKKGLKKKDHKKKEHIPDSLLLRLMQKKLREDRQFREQSNYKYTREQKRTINLVKSRIHEQLRIGISDLKPVPNYSVIHSIAVFGHLDALISDGIPNSDSILTFHKSLERIETALTAQYLPRVIHKYFVDLGSHSSKLQLPGFVSDLLNIGAQVQSCFRNGTKETYTKHMLSEITYYAVNNPNTLLIFFLTDIKSFSSMLFRLKALKIPIIVISPTKNLDLVDYEILCNTCVYFFDAQNLFNDFEKNGFAFQAKSLDFSSSYLTNLKDNEIHIK